MKYTVGIQYTQPSGSGAIVPTQQSSPKLSKAVDKAMAMTEVMPANIMIVVYDVECAIQWSAYGLLPIVI